MFILKLAGKILLLPVWLILFVIGLAVKMTVQTYIIWFHITSMVSDLLIGLCAIMMVISVALYIIQNTRTLKGETV